MLNGKLGSPHSSREHCVSIWLVMEYLQPKLGVFVLEKKFFPCNESFMFLIYIAPTYFFSKMTEYL